MNGGTLPFRTRAVAALILMAVATPAVARGHAAQSPDGRLRAWIKPEAGAQGASGQDASSLWLTDRRTKRSRLLFRGVPSRDPRRDTVSIDNPRFSLDGGYVYVDADAYATSRAIHQIDVRTGTERFVVDGGLLGVIRTGPWRGYLLVGQHRYRANGDGSYDPVLVYRPDGREMLTVPRSVEDGDGAVARWLRAKGWSAS